MLSSDWELPQGKQQKKWKLSCKVYWIFQDAGWDGTECRGGHDWNGRRQQVNSCRERERKRDRERERERETK